MNVKDQQCLQFRLKIFLRRESGVWLKRRSGSAILFGWILRCGDGAVLFKVRDGKRPLTIELDDIVKCCAIN